MSFGSRSPEESGGFGNISESPDELFSLPEYTFSPVDQPSFFPDLTQLQDLSSQQTPDIAGETLHPEQHQFAQKHTEQAPQPYGRGIKLVSPGETFTAQDGFFYTHYKELPDLGMARIFGGRTEQLGERTYSRVGVTVKNGALVIEDADQMEAKDPTLYSLEVEIKPGVRLPEQYEMVCQLQLESVNAIYENTVESVDLEFPEDSSSVAYHWKSTNQTDRNDYEIKGSPQDNDFLSSLSFTFIIRKAKQQTDL